jgi:hypothetical protein
MPIPGDGQLARVEAQFLDNPVQGLSEGKPLNVLYHIEDVPLVSGRTPVFYDALVEVDGEIPVLPLA